MNQLRQLYQFFKTFFPAQKKEEPFSIDGKNEEASKVAAVLISKSIQFANHKGKVSKEIHQGIAESGGDMWLVGHQDGGRGNEFASMRKSAIFTISMVKDHVKTNFEGKKNALETEMKVREEIKDNAKDIFDLQLENYKTLKNYRDKHPKQHSFTLFLLYFVIALFLILADIPLALNLTRQGFDLQSSPSPTEETEITELFKNPWEVIVNHWEVFLLSFGIALCTIYIKILYDELLGSPAHSVITDYKNIPDVQDYEIKEVKEEVRRRRRIKIGIFIITLLTIIILGIFRFETISNSEEGKNLPNSYTTAPAFIFITILFPLIGGICFSIALSNIQNILNLHSAFRQFKKREKYYTEKLKKFMIVQHECKDIEGYLQTWEEKGEAFENYVNFLVACYQHGYSRGLSESEQYIQGKDLFERTEKLRDKVISRKIFNVINKISQKSNFI